MKHLILCFALFAFVHEASGQVVYTDITPDSMVTAAPGQSSQSYFLDLDNDQEYEFELRHTNPGVQSGTMAVEIRINPKQDQLEMLVDENGHVMALEEGAVMSPASKFWDVDMSGMLDGTWFVDTDRYFGFRFRMRGEWRYAWARVRIPFDVSSITVLDYAYEKSANMPITAGSGITGTEDAVLATTPIEVSLLGTSLLVRNPGARDVDLAVHDILGRPMLRRQVAGGVSAVDVSALPRGVYFALLRGPGGDARVRKFQMVK
jgi:hypothetical protein